MNPTNEHTTPSISHVNYGELTSKISEENTPSYDQNKAAYDRITQNFLIKPVQPASIVPQAAVGIQTHDLGTQTMQTFVSNNIALPTIDLFSFIKKAILAFILSLPVSLLIIAFILFLIDIKFNVADITAFPSWSSSKIELFVQETILPQLHN